MRVCGCGGYAGIRYCYKGRGGAQLIPISTTALSRRVRQNIRCSFTRWTDARHNMEQAIGRQLRVEDVPDIILGPEQELLPDDMLKRRRIESSAERLRLAFGRMVETMFGQQEVVERVRQTRGRRVD